MFVNLNLVHTDAFRENSLRSVVWRKQDNNSPLGCVNTIKWHSLPNWPSFYTVVTFPLYLNILFLKHEMAYKMGPVCVVKIKGENIGFGVDWFNVKKIKLFSGCWYLFRGRELLEKQVSG